MNILFPQIGIFLDERFHHLNAVRILEETHSNTLLSHHLFSEGWEVDVLPHQNSGSQVPLEKYFLWLDSDRRFYFVEERGPSAHDAGWQGGDQGQIVPVRSPSSIPKQELSPNDQIIMNVLYFTGQSSLIVFIINYLMATISAWAVGSPVWTLRLCPLETISPAWFAMTDPMGSPPSDLPSSASFIASCSNSECQQLNN